MIHTKGCDPLIAKMPINPGPRDQIEIPQEQQMSRPKVCLRLDNLAFPIELRQHDANQFAVIYGQQQKSRLTYQDAAREIGAAIMHAAACDGLIDTRPLRGA